MLTARKLVSVCAGRAFLAGVWPQWIIARDEIFLSAASSSFREACLLALRQVGLPDVADEILMDEVEVERRSGKILACVDEIS